MTGFGSSPCKTTDSQPNKFGNAGEGKPARTSLFTAEDCTIPRALAAVLIIVALTLCLSHNGDEEQKHLHRQVGKEEVNQVDQAAFRNMEERRLLLKGPGPSKGFYLDIGSSAAKLQNSQRAPHLEKLGYTGICVIPLAGDIGDRRCRQVVLPVAPKDDDKVLIRDCRGVVHAERPSITKQAGWEKQLVQQHDEQADPDCPQVSLLAVGMTTLLHRVAAPPVIDYLSLETYGSELAILETFPFDQYCVRAWAVSLSQTEGNTIQIIRGILEVSHGCRIREGYGEFWARCKCDGNAAAAVEKGSSNAFLPAREKETETKQTISE